MMSGIFVLVRASSTQAASARTEESIIMAHNQLRLNLIHCIHSYADYDQQAGSPKKEIHAYASRQPRRQRVGPKHTVNRRADKRKVLKLKSLKQYLRKQRDHRQINGADSRQSRQYLI